ncbi:hypothetical protein ACJW31_03G183200 [Castanea mollissima]
MNFLSDLQKKSNTSSETRLPEEKNDQNQNQHHQPSNAELMASAKVLAEAGQTTISQGADKVDKARVAGAAGDLLEAASSYGKLEQTSYGKYVEKAETYLDQYGNPSSKSQSHSTTTTTTTTPSHSSTPSTTTDSEPHSAAGGGDHEIEGNTESGAGDYLKMAQGFLKK